MAAVAGASKINTMPKVFIALATYQGAKYLRPLIQSIRRQSYADWTLLARDDGSTDTTPKILRELARRDARIAVLSDGGGHEGAVGNFGAYARGLRPRRRLPLPGRSRRRSGRPTSSKDCWRCCGPASRTPRGLGTVRAHFPGLSRFLCQPRGTVPFSGRRFASLPENRDSLQFPGLCIPTWWWWTAGCERSSGLSSATPGSAMGDGSRCGPCWGGVSYWVVPRE